MKRRYSFVILSLITSGIVFCLPLNAQEKSVTLENVWKSVKSEGDKLLDKSLSEGKNLLDKSIKITSEFVDDLGAVLDTELDLLRAKQTQPSEVDVRDKIDTIRIYVENISDLKKQEGSASSFTLISKSKKGSILMNKSQINDLIENNFDNNDFLMIKASNATGFNKIVKELKGAN